jgi:uncharacterized protein (DUF433 family)
MTRQFPVTFHGIELQHGPQRNGYNRTQRCNEGLPVQFERITLNPAVMGGKPCIRGLRVTVGTILGLLAAGKSRERILEAYPYLEAEDLDAVLAYAAWRLEEREEPLAGI